MTNGKGKPRGRKGGAKPGPTPPMVSISIRMPADQAQFINAIPKKADWLRGVVDRAIAAELGIDL
jgi:hypothetical protein